MNNAAATTDNPFATRYVRPGALEYVFPDGESVDDLIEQLRSNEWCGEIIGPHGAGKSALLASLIPRLREAGRFVVLITLRDGEHRLPGERVAEIAQQPDTLLVVDGYEQLSRFRRWQIKRRCRRAGCGLLVTAHTSVGLPSVYHVAPRLEMVQRIVDALANGSPTITPADVAASYQHQEHNVRETLFDLYNFYEQRRRQSS